LKSLPVFIVKGFFLLTVAQSIYGADALRFTSGTVSNFTAISLNLAGPSNLVIQVERLNRTNDVWESQGNVTLGGSGTGTFNSSLIEGIYGFFRAKATNNSTFSTNAFGAVCGYLGNGLSIIGNMFKAQDLTNVLTTPVNGMQAYKWDNSSGSFASYSYVAAFGAWSPSSFVVDPMEGIFVRNPQTNINRYTISGLFDTNAISKSLPSGYSLICSQRYHVVETNTWKIDILNTNQLGGASQVPVQSPGFNPQAIINKALDNVPNYSTNNLTSGNLWQSGGTNVVVPLNITEGFWLNKPTNATWVVNRTIW